MKTVGLLNFTPRSLKKYYFELNDLFIEKYGINSSADIIMNSMDLRNFLLSEKDDEKLITLVSKELLSLEKGGADFVLMGANSPHLFYDELKNRINIPIIHIADVVEQKLNEQHIKKVGLLSTKRTVENNFYTDKFKDNIEVLTPNNDDIEFINNVVYNELIGGVHNVNSRKKIIEISEGLVKKGAEAIILGSSEFIYFIRDEHISVPVIDITLAHTQKAFELVIEE